jgi:peptidyl-prolyl cis-trans isomerase B (cyclophilin B)
VAGNTDQPQAGSRTRAAKARDFAAEREAARQQARRRITVAVAVVVVVAIAAVVLGAVVSTHHATNATGAPGDDNAALALTGTGSSSCSYTPTGSPARDVGQPPANGVAPGTYQATMATNQGTITIALNGTKAPCTVNSFIYLAAKGYFNATNCHRLTTSGIFVLQCGDPTASGEGGPGYQFADENLTGATYPAGTVAMANAGPGTNGSQFFLVYKDTELPASYTPFGTITGGLDALNAIAAKGTADGSGDGSPKTPVTISTLKVTKTQ